MEDFFFFLNENLKPPSWMEVDLLNLFIKLLDNIKLRVIPCMLEHRLRICKVLDGLK